MRQEVEQFLKDLPQYYPGDDYAEYRDRIRWEIKKAAVRREYWERFNGEYGESTRLKLELSEKYYMSYDKVEDAVYPKPEYLKSVRSSNANM